MSWVTGKIRFSLQGFFLTALFYMTPFFDAITGYLVLSGLFSESFIGSPSQLIRAVIFAISLKYILRDDLYKFGAFLVFFLCVELISFLLHQQIGGLITSIVFTYKLLYPIIIYFSLKGFLKKGYIDIPTLKDYFYNSGFLYGVGVVGPFFLGIGFSTYGEGAFGTKGFFSSGNGLGMFLGVICVLSFYGKAYRRSVLALIKFLVTAAALLLVGTKASMIFLLVILLLAFISMRPLYKIVTLLTVVLISVYYRDLLMNSFATVYDVILLRFERSESIWSFIFSGRDNYVKDAFGVFKDDGLLFYRNILGGGSFLSFRDPAEFVPAFDTLETDLFDIFFMYGIIGVAVYCGITLMGTYTAVIRRMPMVMFFFLVVMAHSLVAGHVIFNGMSVLGVVLLLLIANFQPLKIGVLND